MLMDSAKANKVNFQDLHTVRSEPHRLMEWTEIAMQLAEEYA